MAKGKGYRVNMAKPRRALIKRAERAFALVNEEDLPQAFDFSLGADIWSWPRDTERQNGEVAGRIRNAVDEGDLADSYERQREGRRRYIHRWGVPYAVVVHNGATLSNGTVLPPRPWTDEGVDAIPMLFARRFKELG
jgi:hypothetical protein